MLESLFELLLIFLAGGFLVGILKTFEQRPDDCFKVIRSRSLHQAPPEGRFIQVAQDASKLP